MSTDSLGIAANQAQAVITNLRNALHEAGAVEALLLMPMIDAAAKLAQQIEALKSAKGFA